MRHAILVLMVFAMILPALGQEVQERDFGAAAQSQEFYERVQHFMDLGMEREEVEALLTLSCTRSKIPEPLRAAHLIGGGLVFGQSGRRA